MKIKALLLTLLTPLLAIANEEVKTVDQPAEKPATIKVLLERCSEGVLLEARGPYVVYNPENGKRESSFVSTVKLQ